MKNKLFLVIVLLTFLTGTQVHPETKIAVVAYSKTVPHNSDIHITGQGNALGNWQRMIPMEKISRNRWRFIISAKTGDTLQFKFTRGSWRTEAADSMGMEYFNFMHVVKTDTTLSYNIPHWRDEAQHKVFITEERLKNKSGYVEIYEGWKYFFGDDSVFADPQYNDSAWKSISTPLLNKEEFNKMGWKWPGRLWYRNHIVIDSLLINKPLGINFFNTGAAEIYLDGRLLYKFGNIGNSASDEKTYFDRIPRSIIFADSTNHILAVRFSNFDIKDQLTYNAPVGFLAVIGDINTLIADRINIGREVTVHQMGFGAFILAFALVHLLLFVFYPRSKENLYYSIALLSFVAVIYSGAQTYFATTVWSSISMTVVNSVAIQVSLIFGLLTVYSSSHKKLPGQFIIFLIISALFILHTIALPADLWQPYIDYGFYIYALITTFEIFRVEIKALRDKQTKGWEWLVGLGVIFAILFITYQILINLGIAPPLFGINLVYVYGIVILAITMSVHLSKRISSTNKNLEEQLNQVKELSRITLEHERRAKDEEIARKLLEADNERKTKELEEARKLQYAMLPRKVPPVPELDIAVYMKPAAEVGGDYYDFKYDNEGNLIVAVGDATGHGMKAGTLVATIKGLFTAESFHTDILTFLNKCNLIIRDMQLGNLFMAMMVAKIHTNSGISMSFSSAGMPPALIYRAKTKDVEEHRILGLPLGGSFTQLGGYYSKKETLLSSGDILLLMSDGFPELFNKEKEILDYDKAREIFCRIAAENHSSSVVIDELLIEANKWMNGADQQDDITFVVIRVK